MTFQDPLFFEQTFKSEFDSLCNMANKIVGSQEIAEDLVQNLFLSIWKKRNKIKVKSSVKAYLTSSIINLSYNHIRSQKRRDSLRPHSDLISNQTEQAIHFNELHNRIDAAIKKLPPKCQVIFSLSRFQGMSNSQIASHLEISNKTVENQIGIALKKLRKELQPYIVLGFFGLLVLIVLILIISLL